MPKNQFQRPLRVTPSHQVPRHGKPQPPASRPLGKASATRPEASLPPLAALLDKAPDK